MTKEEAKKMEGTEFTYVFKDGDTMPAYVKKVDLESGKMSCWSFSLVTDGGFVFTPSNADEAREGAACVTIGLNWEETLERLTAIRDIGRWVDNEIEDPSAFFPGCMF